MPRTKKSPQTPRKPRKPAAEPTLAERTADAIAALPFAPDREPTDPANFANLPEEVRVQIAASIAKDRAAGLSGNDLRGKYAGASEAHSKGRGLTGPMRRKVLREYGAGSLVARSYSEYRDGTAREGSAHARMHGPLAAERAAAALAALAEERADSTPAKEQGAALRAAGRTVPRKPDARRAAFVALLREEGVASAA